MSDPNKPDVLTDAEWDDLVKLLERIDEEAKATALGKRRAESRRASLRLVELPEDEALVRSLNRRERKRERVSGKRDALSMSDPVGTTPAGRKPSLDDEED